ncbi:MAG TPA: hypothetical protein VGB26_14555, partial [Nitrospiria bacterium]
TEIAATPPRGRMFGQVEYLYTRKDPDNGPKVSTHLLPLEFEIGVGERTQLNLEAAVLLEEKIEGVQGKSDGIQEIAFGLKHRFFDETETLPDAGFLVEFAPAAGLKGDEAELKTTFLFTKNLSNSFLFHLETGYLLETEREIEVEGTVIGGGPDVEGEGKTHVQNAHIFVYNLAPIFRVIPDRLLLVTELNGESNFKTHFDHIMVRPEVIFVIQELALKFAVPVGITSEADDWGFHFGISKLF